MLVYGAAGAAPKDHSPFYGSRSTGAEGLRARHTRCRTCSPRRLIISGAEKDSEPRRASG